MHPSVRLGSLAALLVIAAQAVLGCGGDDLSVNTSTGGAAGTPGAGGQGASAGTTPGAGAGGVTSGTGGVASGAGGLSGSSGQPGNSGTAGAGQGGGLSMAAGPGGMDGAGTSSGASGDSGAGGNVSPVGGLGAGGAAGSTSTEGGFGAGGSGVSGQTGAGGSGSVSCECPNEGVPGLKGDECAFPSNSVVVKPMDDDTADNAIDNSISSSWTVSGLLTVRPPTPQRMSVLTLWVRSYAKVDVNVEDIKVKATIKVTGDDGMDPTLLSQTVADVGTSDDTAILFTLGPDTNVKELTVTLSITEATAASYGLDLSAITFQVCPPTDSDE